MCGLIQSFYLVVKDDEDSDISEDSAGTDSVFFTDDEIISVDSEHSEQVC